MTQDNALEPTHSDLELFEQLFQLVGIEYRKFEYRNGDCNIILQKGFEKVGGFKGHTAQFQFQDGKFLRINMRDH